MSCLIRMIFPLVIIIFIGLHPLANPLPLTGVTVNNILQDTIPETEDSFFVKFERVEEEVSFPGGENAWLQYLQKNIDTNIPTKKKAPAGTYTVIVQFILDREGNISDVRALTNHGYGMEDEVLRVIKKTSRWTPAKQNGRIVKAYRKQAVTFQVEGKKKKKNKQKDD